MRLYATILIHPIKMCIFVTKDIINHKNKRIWKHP